MKLLILFVLVFLKTSTPSILFKADMTANDAQGKPGELDDESLARDVRGQAPQASKSVLATDQFVEKGCSNVNPAANLKLKWIQKVPAWYVPMAHVFFYNTYSRRLTKQMGVSKFDAGDLCLKLLYLASKEANAPYWVVAGGHEKAIMYKCIATGPHNQNCDSVVDAPDYMDGVDIYETIVATDNKTYLLMFRCTRNSIKSWYAMSPYSNFTKETQAAIIAQVKAMKFENLKEMAGGIPYEKCLKGPGNGVDPSAQKG